MKIGLKLLVAVVVAVFALTSCNKENFTDQLSQDNAALSGENLETNARGFNANIRRSGAAYVMDNAVGSNHVLVLDRHPDGTLGKPRRFATNGGGSGGGLGSQGSIVSDGEYLYVCNAGSNEISVMRMIGNNLKFVDKITSLGTMPISLSVHGNIVYVLNAGGSGNIVGFRFTYGRLSHIPGAIQPLSTSGAGPAQISFNKEGDVLVVTEKATNRITTYPVAANGVAGPGTSFPSAGQTPFGFEFSPDGDLIVSEAFGGNTNASAVSSYDLDGSGNVGLITGPVLTNQTAACWVVVTDDGEFAYASNTGSASVTGYRIRDGKLHLLNADGITGVTGNGPIDMDMSPGSIFLYVVNAADNSISVLSRRYNGQLYPVQTVSGLPDAVVGIAVE